jgi:hypothetical protein
MVNRSQDMSSGLLNDVLWEDAMQDGTHHICTDGFAVSVTWEVEDIVKPNRQYYWQRGICKIFFLELEKDPNVRRECVKAPLWITIAVLNAIECLEHFADADTLWSEPNPFLLKRIFDGLFHDILRL